ncbi:hypothetical protein GCM10011585_36690 [Edaphobacter dinghuensis]|uniref:Uncharacterized protein n=1 Tax=Edaphobacter dinghuensis TaxID=1560005 RepID=A0A917MBA9_9BACT|nr:hypothetical protein GCM10011585_36690 [Edaphobacter dinghuensis]
MLIKSLPQGGSIGKKTTCPSTIDNAGVSVRILAGKVAASENLCAESREVMSSYIIH